MARTKKAEVNDCDSLKQEILKEVKSLLDKRPVVEFKLDSGARMPIKATEGSSGYDVLPNIRMTMWIDPGERKVIPTGLYCSLPLGFELQVRARSGWALKKGISIVQGVGTIDSDYRGEIGILLVNNGRERVEITRDTKIAQLVFCKVEHPEIFEVTELDETQRGTGGFGSTGGM